MESVADGLAAVLARVRLAPPKLPLACNGGGGWMEAATATDPSYWAGHVSRAVRWDANMDLLAALAKEAGGDGLLAVEVGSGSSLAPLLAECTADGASALSVLSTLRHPREDWAGGAADERVFADALCGLWEVL